MNVDQVTLARELANDLYLYRTTCPLGALLCVFEARPEVLIQIMTLSLKSGNAIVLKGGKEAHHTLQALYQVYQNTCRQMDSIPLHSVQLIQSRETFQALLQYDHVFSMVIPRGSKQLIQMVQTNTRIPVLGHADGICSIYLDQDAQVSKILPILVDAKTTYPAACNAVETLLIHTSLLDSIWSNLANELIKRGIRLRCDSETYSRIPELVREKGCRLACDQDYATEYLDLEMSVRSVKDWQEAVNHIRQYGSGHTDVIVTENATVAKQFLRQVDAAGVYWNVSSRFADGFRYGLGAEVGVSTSKTHARGPVGLEGLVTYKYLVHGRGTEGHTVAPFTTGERVFTHRNLSFDAVQNDPLFQ